MGGGGGGDHRDTGLVQRLIRTIRERLLVMAQEYQKPSVEPALLKIIKCLRTITEQSLNCSPFEAHFGRSPKTIWHILVKSPSSNNLGWNKTLLCIDKGRKLMCRDKRHDWDTPDDIEDGDQDENSSSSDAISNAVGYVPTSADSPVKVLTRDEKRDALGVKYPLLNEPPGKTTIYFAGKNQLVKLYATKRPKKIIKPQRNVGFKEETSKRNFRNQILPGGMPL